MRRGASRQCRAPGVQRNHDIAPDVPLKCGQCGNVEPLWGNRYPPFPPFIAASLTQTPTFIAMRMLSVPPDVIVPHTPGAGPFAPPPSMAAFGRGEGCARVTA